MRACVPRLDLLGYKPGVDSAEDAFFVDVAGDESVGEAVAWSDKRPDVMLLPLAEEGNVKDRSGSQPAGCVCSALLLDAVFTVVSSGSEV